MVYCSTCSAWCGVQSSAALHVYSALVLPCLGVKIRENKRRDMTRWHYRSRWGRRRSTLTRVDLENPSWMETEKKENEQKNEKQKQNESKSVSKEDQVEQHEIEKHEQVAQPEEQE